MFSRGECFKEREQTIPNLIVGEFQKQQTSGNAVSEGDGKGFDSYPVKSSTEDRSE